MNSAPEISEGNCRALNALCKARSVRLASWRCGDLLLLLLFLYLLPLPLPLLLVLLVVVVVVLLLLTLFLLGSLLLLLDTPVSKHHGKGGQAVVQVCWVSITSRLTLIAVDQGWLINTHGVQKSVRFHSRSEPSLSKLTTGAAWVCYSPLVLS